MGVAKIGFCRKCRRTTQHQVDHPHADYIQADPGNERVVLVVMVMGFLYLALGQGWIRF